MEHKILGKTGMEIPPIIFGTSCLGNLYAVLPDKIKLRTIKEMFIHSPGLVYMDTAGKYGAGLALEVIGKGLKKLGIQRGKVAISNKLGWYRIPLETREPTFEPGIWMGLEHDAQLTISYDGILKCWEQGCQLLGEEFQPQFLSVHDPDEYLASAKNEMERKELFNNIVEAYRALIELKKQKKILAVGIGAKNWKIIREIVQNIDLDWVMLANSLTIYRHPQELLDFIDELHRNNIWIINSAVFHAGFLTGGEYFDYREIDSKNKKDKPLFEWRNIFFDLCQRYNVSPAVACVQFGMSHPAVQSTALNTSKPERIKENVAMVSVEISEVFWRDLKNEGLISENYPYVG